MDNSPRGGAIRDGSSLCHIDLSSQQALTARCIASIAGVLGKKRLVNQFELEFNDLKEKINRMMWHDKSGFYYDIFYDPAQHGNVRNNFLNHKTIAGFWPMLAGVAARSQVDRLVEHLLNPLEFWRKHPAASLAGKLGREAPLAALV